MTKISCRRALTLLVAGLLGACATGSPPAPAPDVQQLIESAPPAPEVLVPAAILAGELAAQRGQRAAAAEHYAEAAGHSADARVAARATQLALGAENPSLAMQSAQRWVELEPANAGAHEIVARLALHQQRYDLARDHLLRAIELSPAGPEQGLVDVADALAADPAQADKALEIFDAIAASVDEPAAAHYARALLALRLDRAELARQSVSEALALRGDWREAQLLALRLHLQAGEMDAADILIRDLHVAAPKDLDLRLALGRLLLEHDHLELARKEYRNALRIAPGNPNALYPLALIEIDDGRYAQAKKHFRALLEQPQRRADAHFYLGRIAEEEGEDETAMEHYRQVSRGQRQFDAAVRQAVVLAGQGQLAAARTYLQNLRSAFPQQELHLFEVEGELLYRADEMAAAKAVYDEALVRYPDDPDLLYGRALAYEQLGDIAAAEADLRQIIEADQEDARALNALGYILTNHSERYAEARDYVERAIALTPDDAAVIDSLGWLYYREGKLEQAQGYLQRAYEKMDDPEIAAHFGEVLWMQGERDRAREVWRKALAEHPEHRALNETVDRLAGEL